jgi:NitT/TauT family transport system ATP-binding protein
MSSTEALRLDAVTHRFVAASGPAYTAVERITLDIRAGTFLSIVGPSGCGKSTVLNIIAGLLVPTEGTVEIFGERLHGINQKASYMFQQDALLPWKTVQDNILLGLELRRHDRREARELAAAWIKRVGLDGFASRYPYQLSGGMRKWVALAQTWIVQPDILLMDEPFSALDIHTRQRMEAEILTLWTASTKTVLFVTHDLEEAVALSDEVVVLSAGPGSQIIGRYPVNLARPRNLIDIRTEPQFREVYRSIWSDLRQEVLKSYERNG